MKIAITWSKWFVWSYLVRYLSTNNDIFAFNRNINKSILKITYIKWDLKYKYIWQEDFDVFIHAAADTWYEKTKEEMIENNVIVNKNILDFVNRSNCRHFIYISSSSVYQCLSWKITTNINIDKENLQNSYSLSKYLSEEYISHNLNKSINLTILRPRAIYWKWDRVLVPNILKNKIFWRLILPWNWKNITSVTEINDFIKKIEEVIVSNKYWIYNISTKIESYNYLYKTIVVDFNLKWIIRIPLFLFKLLSIINKNKYSYIVDTFWNDKIL